MRFIQHMFLALALICAGAIAASAAPQTSQASQAPQLAALDGSHWISPGKFDGRPSTILFWSPDCPPCRIELAHLAALLAADPENVLILAAIGRKSDIRRVLDSYKRPTGVQNAMAPKNPRGLLARLGNRPGALPFAVRFDSQGRACATATGPLSPAGVRQMRQKCTAPTDKQ